MNKNKKALYLYLLIVLILSAVSEGILIATGNMLLMMILMWMPALSALIAKLVFYKGEKGILGFRKCQMKYIWQALLLPFFYFGIPYLIYWIIFPGTLKFEFSTTFMIIVVSCIPLSMTTALGEEIGWRGFMVPRMLEAWGFEKMLCASSLIWCIWHMPILISGVYMPGTPLVFKIVMFIINIGSVGVIAGILTIRAKSVWPAAFLHAAHNAYDQAIFSVYTVGENKMYFVSETGIITAVVVVGIAVYMYLSEKKSLTQSTVEA